MEIRIQVIVDNDERTRRDVGRFERASFAPETLGLQLEEAKALLQSSQQAMVAAQTDAFLAHCTVCGQCGRAHRLKGRHDIVVRSLFGTLRLSSPRFYRCSCEESAARKSFSPLAEILPERTLPERLYLEAKWASLVSYGVTAQLLEEVLPLEGAVNVSSLRRHVHRIGRRCEEDLLANTDTELRRSEVSSAVMENLVQWTIRPTCIASRAPRPIRPAPSTTSTRTNRLWARRPKR